ncbi:MAG TPA: hypothetical protein VFK56_01150 [Mycobacterium sp.]|nr:hypothetical protein [Mycobacterium sp.]
MPRFVDKNATYQLDLGECQCPPNPDGSQPHARDEASIRTQLSYGEWIKIAEANSEIEGVMTLLLIRVKSWSLRDANGKPVPVTRQSLEDLDKPTAELLQAAVVRESEGNDPPNT